MPGLNHLAFRVEDPEDLATLEDRLERHEYRVQRISAGEQYAIGEAIRFTAPSEQRIEAALRHADRGQRAAHHEPGPISR